jgi:hypothetical protein
MFVSSERMSYKYKKSGGILAVNPPLLIIGQAQGLKINALFILRIPDSTHKQNTRSAFFFYNEQERPV